jgi:REP element-mobilizing transposase RayT
MKIESVLSSYWAARYRSAGGSPACPQEKPTGEPPALLLKMEAKRNIRQLISDKRTWTKPSSAVDEKAGFRSWYSRGYLPHFDAPGIRQMITYRLQDAMPANRRHEWEQILKLEDERQRRTNIEAYLDRGHGECQLRKQEIATLVEDNLLHFDGSRYRLLAWAVMPNHVHALIETYQTPLADILHTWKSYTGKAANRLLKRSGDFWQTEYFDRYIRDEEHYGKALRYIENNPVKAGLVKFAHEWPFGSARHRSAGGSPANSSTDTRASRPRSCP